MPGHPHAYRLEPARTGDAAQLAAMSEAHVEQGLRPAWSAARIRWHVRDPDSVVLTARLGASIAGFAGPNAASAASGPAWMAHIPTSLVAPFVQNDIIELLIMAVVSDGAAMHRAGRCAPGSGPYAGASHAEGRQRRRDHGRGG